MKSLSEIKGDDALDLIADLMEPAGNIMADPEVRDAYYNSSRAAAISKAIKNHKKDVKTVLALMDGEDPKTYEPNVMTIPARLLEIMNDPELVSLFTSQGQNQSADTSGSALENTKAPQK